MSLSPPLEKGGAFHLNKLKSPSPKDALCQVWLKLAKRFWRRRFFNFVTVFSLFRNHLPLEKGGVLHLNKLESPSPKDALCHVWLKLAQWFWRRRFFNFVNDFRYFVIISHSKRAEPFIWTNFNLNTQGCIVPSLVEIGPVVREKKLFFNFVNVFSLFRNYLPLEKSGALHLNKFESRNPRMLCAKFGWNWPSGSGEEDENVKSLRQRRQRRTTDKFWSEKLTWAFGSGKLNRV